VPYSDPRNYYYILGLPQGVGSRLQIEEIQQAYEKRGSDLRTTLVGCKENCDDYHRFQIYLEEAVKTLGNPESKLAYDQGIKNYSLLLNLSMTSTTAEAQESYNILSKKFLFEINDLNCNNLPSTSLVILNPQALRILYCSLLREKLADLDEALRVFKDGKSQMIIRSNQPEYESLSYVTTPLKLLSENPLIWIFTIVITIGVLHTVHGWLPTSDHND